MKTEVWTLVRTADNKTVSRMDVEVDPVGTACGVCNHDPNDNSNAAAVCALASLGYRVQVTAEDAR